jgi:hypothetical protein
VGISRAKAVLASDRFNAYAIDAQNGELLWKIGSINSLRHRRIERLPPWIPAGERQCHHPCGDDGYGYRAWDCDRLLSFDLEILFAGVDGCFSSRVGHLRRREQRQTEQDQQDAEDSRPQRFHPVHVLHGSAYSVFFLNHDDSFPPRSAPDTGKEEERCYET